MIGLVLLFGLSACSPDAPVVDLTPTEPAVATEIPPVAEVSTTAPTPVAQPSVLLVTEGDVDPFVISQIQNVLASLADDSSMNLMNMDGLTAEAISPGVQVVVGVGQNLDLNTFAANAPDVNFVAIGDPNAVVAGNLSVIGDPVNDARQKAFMAGYLSALISSDSKIAALIPEENPASDLLAESYVVGARFFCGLCQPLYPPYNPFPQWATLPSEGTEDRYQLVVDNYHNMGVEVMFVHGELISPELLAYLGELDMKVVSDRSADFQWSNWVGTITTDPAPALEAIWPDLLMSAPGKQIPSAIVLSEIEMGWVSEGRYRLFEAMVADLQAGLVSFEITP